MKNLIAVCLLLTAVVFIASSCQKSREATAVITVLKDSVSVVTQKKSEVPAALAEVRFYLDIVGAEHIDTTIRTSTTGKAEFVWFEAAIMKYDITYGSFSSLGNYITLEQGETIEKTVNVSRP
ncbi:hypothetical protein ACFLR1_00655 [Bacteroidota bacterium]